MVSCSTVIDIFVDKLDSSTRSFQTSADIHHLGVIGLASALLLRPSRKPILRCGRVV
jgi:hypothetical protein